MGNSFFHSFLQMNTIFISIVVEALPFILIGVFFSGIIQIFVTEEMLSKLIPKNRFLAVLVSVLLGFIFPGCECGIVPIVTRLIAKGVPPYAAIAFMLTGPIINPIVLFATFIAFGNNIHMVILRCLTAIIVAYITGIVLSYSKIQNPLLKEHTIPVNYNVPLKQKLWDVCVHAIEEFFSMGKFLIIGAFIAASVQTFISTDALVKIGHGPFLSSLVMMALAFILSLCSEADAFVASSFQSTFSTSSIVAFMVFGPMVDIKNTFMLFNNFKKGYVLRIIGLAFGITLLLTTFI
ncbi:permease [Bacillus sp. RG28]|uniref:Permease n=1 Tax=Gottfriedia endophytica TaxID=2820819 RepID=A0A940SIS5_9BACI|nr:permease [Gottfriedia endophytica]MBP0724129.1 permease [Gottfriedia endophytica]